MINFFQWCATAFLFGLYLFSNCLTDFGIKTGDQDDSMGEFLSANNKNSSGDEIANVNFFLRRYCTRTSKCQTREPTSFNKLDDS